MTIKQVLETRVFTPANLKQAGHLRNRRAAFNRNGLTIVQTVKLIEKYTDVKLKIVVE